MAIETVPVGIPQDFEALGRAKVVDQWNNGVRLETATATVEVVALAPDLFRVGMFVGGRPAGYSSEAVSKANWEPLSVHVSVGTKEVTLATGAATAHIGLDPLRVRFEDVDGRRFAEDVPDLGMGYFGPIPESKLEAALGPAVRLYKRHAAGEHYFGCGERTGGLDKTTSHQIFWNIDPPIGHTATLNNMYTSIPFMLSLRDGKAWGLFFDNTYRVEFDLAEEDPERSWFGAAGGDLIYYVFSGPSVRSVLDRYTELTGRIPMPPLWSLGYQQSRYSYMDEQEVLDTARQFRERGIPADVIYLDIHYMDGYRVFTWNPERFPDPERMISQLHDIGFKVVTIIDPGVKVDDRYRVYQEARDNDYFVKTYTGREYWNVVWPGLSAFPDFTSSRVRAWWGRQFEVLVDKGVDGIWCDMDEPALFIPYHGTMPGDAVHLGDDNPKLHAQVHNLYGSLMAHATHEGLRELRPDERPLVITRAGFAGLQRYALQWTGDNSSWWEHLWMSMPQLQNMGLSGVAWVGVDVGGFFGDTTAELLTRWTEFGIFQPFVRNHTGLDTRSQEPWAFGQPYESLIRDMIQLRYRLIPYVYTLFEECHRSGAPILRPLLFEYPDDETTYSSDDEFLLGNALLVAPITSHGREYRHVYLPKGDWFHLWSGQRSAGPMHVLAHAPLGQPPVYVKANVPISLWPVMNYVGERSSPPLTLLIFPAPGRGELALYEDAGTGYDFEHGGYSRRLITCETDANRVVVRLAAQEGSYVPGRQELEIELRETAQPQNVQINGQAAHFAYQSDSRTVTITVPETRHEVTVEVLL